MTDYEDEAPYRGNPAVKWQYGGAHDPTEEYEEETDDAE